MGGDVQPVRVPVVVEVEKSALAGLGDEVRRARDAGGAAGSAAAAAPASASSPDIVSVRAVLREFQRLEAAVQGVADLFERVAKMQIPGTAAGAPAMTTRPLAHPGAGAPPDGGHGGGEHRAPSAWRPRPTEPGLALAYGALGVVGLGIGIGAAFAEVAKMAASSRTFGEEAFIAGSGGGGGTREGVDISRGLLGPSRFPLLAKPEDSMRTIDQLRRQGSRATPEDTRLLSELGFRELGSPQAGGAFAGQMYQATRSDRAVELLASIAEYGRQTGQGVTALTSEFADLTRTFTERQGVHRTTEDEDRERLTYLAYLRSLPRGIGEGAGGMQITQGVMGAAQGGFGRMNLMDAYMRETGRGVSSPEDYFQFQLWSAKPSNVVPAMMQQAKLGARGDKGLEAILLMDFGLTAQQAAAYRDAPPDERKRMMTMLSRPDAERTVAERAGLTAGGEGAGSLEARAARARAEAERTIVTRAQEEVDRLIAKSPTGAAAAEGLGGIGLRSLAQGIGIGAGGLGGLQVLRRVLRRGAGAALPARAAGAARAGGLTMRGLGLLGGGLLAKDIYDAHQDPKDNWRDLLPALGGAIGGALLTGTPMGAMAGAGITSQLFKMLFGNTRDVEAAAVERRGGASALEGWQRAEVAEHLALLRQLVAADLRRRAAWDGGSADPLGPMHFGGAKAEAEFTTTFPAPLSSRGASRLSPNDPRIAAAARAAHVPTALLLGLIQTESDFDPTAVSPKGARGLTQLMPGTARDLGVRDAFDVGDNLMGGARYLRQMIDRYPGNLPRALYAYNAGPRRADEGGEHAADRSDYDERVLAPTRRAAAALRRADAREKELKTTNDPEAQALRMREIEDAVLGPRDDDASSGGSGHDLVVRLEPAPGLEDIVRPSRTVLPGARRRRPQ